MKRNVQSREQSLRLIQTFKESGLSVKQFCIKHDITIHYFYYWNKRYRQKNKPVSNFIKIKPALPLTENKKITEVILLNGNRIVFYQQMDVNLMKQMLM